MPRYRHRTAFVTSGARVIVVMFAAVLVIALVAVGAFLLTNEPAVRCVEGELQDNAVRADGTFIPRVETYQTLEEAESFICRRIPHPRDVQDLDLAVVRVAREGNLASLIEGEAGASIELEYALDGEAQLRLQVTFPPRGGPPGAGTAGERITIKGRPAVLQTSASGTQVTWVKDGFEYRASAVPSFDREKLLQTLESVR